MIDSKIYELKLLKWLLLNYWNEKLSEWLNIHLSEFYDDGVKIAYSFLFELVDGYSVLI